MNEVGDILEQWFRTAGMTWSYAASLLSVTSTTLFNWRTGRALPHRRQAEQLATLVNRPDLVDIIERQRASERQARAAERAAAPPAESPSSATIRIPLPQRRPQSGGAA